MWQNLHDEGYNNMDNDLLSCSYDHLFDDPGKIRYILLEVYWHSFRYLLEPAMDWKQTELQIILFEIDCAISYTNWHELFCQFISWTNKVNSGKFMKNCWISWQVMADMEKIYDDLMIINL